MKALWIKMQRHVTSRYFIVLFTIYLVGISSILRANRFYLDDMGRALYGYTNWSPSARPLTELLAWIFYAGPVTLDASPLTQMIAIFILTLSSFLLLEALRLRISWWTVLCTIPIGLSPYGLENLSYKFDAPSMALALFFSVLPCCLILRSVRGAWWLSAVFLFASASLYQPALGAYLAICIYQTLKDLSTRKTFRLIIQRLTCFVIPFILGVGIYVLQAPLWFRSSEYTNYIQAHSSLPPLSALPTELFTNINDYVLIVLNDWSCNSLGLLFALLCVLFALSFLFRCLRNLSIGNTINKSGFIKLHLTKLFCILLLLPFFWLTPFGVQLLLANPVWAPRTFHGFGVMLALMLLHLNRFSVNNINRVVIRIVQGVIIWQLIIFAQLYGNLLDDQNRWEFSHITLLAQDLNSYIKETSNNQIAFVGSVGRSPLTTKAISQFPLLSNLVTVPLTSTWRWGYEQLNTFGVKIIPQELPTALATGSLTLFLERPNYRIETAPNNIGIVTFLSSAIPQHGIRETIQTNKKR